LVHDLGDALDAVLEDALDARLERHRRCGAAHTRTDELDRHDSGLLVHVVQADVAAVGLDGRTDLLDCLLDLLAHGSSLGSGDIDGRTSTTDGSNDQARARIPGPPNYARPVPRRLTVT